MIIIMLLDEIYQNSNGIIVDHDGHHGLAVVESYSYHCDLYGK